MNYNPIGPIDNGFYRFYCTFNAFINKLVSRLERILCEESPLTPCRANKIGLNFPKCPAAADVFNMPIVFTQFSKNSVLWIADVPVACVKEHSCINWSSIIKLYTCAINIVMGTPSSCNFLNKFRCCFHAVLL
jgi:hypothetical protein